MVNKFCVPSTNGVGDSILFALESDRWHERGFHLDIYYIMRKKMLESLNDIRELSYSTSFAS